MATVGGLNDKYWREKLRMAAEGFEHRPVPRSIGKQKDAGGWKTKSEFKSKYAQRIGMNCRW